MLWALYEMRSLIPALPVEIHFAGFMSEESAQLGSQQGLGMQHVVVRPPYLFVARCCPQWLQRVSATRAACQAASWTAAQLMQHVVNRPP